MLNNAIIAVAALAAFRPVDAIWPVPQQISTGQDVLFVDKSIQVTYNGEPVRWNQVPSLSSYAKVNGA